jgi:hypothetical protein
VSFSVLFALLIANVNQDIKRDSIYLWKSWIFKERGMNSHRMRMDTSSNPVCNSVDNSCGSKTVTLTQSWFWWEVSSESQVPPGMIRAMWVSPYWCYKRHQPGCTRVSSISVIPLPFIITVLPSWHSCECTTPHAYNVKYLHMYIGFMVHCVCWAIEGLPIRDRGFNLLCRLFRRVLKECCCSS